MDITLLQLRSFLAAAELLNFTAAAEKLRIKQPTLSSNIKSLEAAVGGKLFDRDTHRVKLTDLGLECQRHAHRLLEDVDRTQSELKKRVLGVAGSIRMAALPYIFPTLLAGPLAQFRRQWPEINFQFQDVSTREAIELLRQGHVDLAVANELSQASDIRYHLLAERRLVALMRQDHPLAGLEHLGWRQLMGQDLIVIHSKEMDASHIIESLRNADLLPSITHKVNQLSTAVGLVEAGFGIALMAHHTAVHAKQSHFVIRKLVEPELVGRISLMTIAHKELSPQVRLLQETLVSFLKSAPRG